MSSDLRCFRLRIVNANELCFFEFVVFADVVGVLKKENCIHDAWLILGLREEKWETIRPRRAAIHHRQQFHIHRERGGDQAVFAVGGVETAHLEICIGCHCTEIYVEELRK